MRTAEDIKKEVLEESNGDVQAAIYALEDGKYLEDAGYNEDDIVLIEDAHAALKEMLN